MQKGYIYIRDHESYHKYNIYKLGKTNSIPDRESIYITSEYERGKFIVVYQVNKHYLNDIEKILQYEFMQYHKELNGGTEFYDTNIINLIEPFFINNNIQYIKLTDFEIYELTRTKRDNTIYKPRDYQMDIIREICYYFNNKNKGLVIIPCGVGKTLISLWTVQRMLLNKIVIGVPNLLLVNQWIQSIRHIFNDIPILKICDDITEHDIRHFLKSYNKYIIITTYTSSDKLLSVSNQLNYQYDIKILDEVHHLTTNNINNITNNDITKRYINILKVKSNKQLALTATTKEIKAINTVGNNNKEYFGDIIIKRSLLWAINHNIICDYKIQTILADEIEFNDSLNKLMLKVDDTRLFLSAYVALLSINKYNSQRILIYLNNINNAEKVIGYIKEIIEHNIIVNKELYYSCYHSNMSVFDQNNILQKFGKSKYGIITCVYSLGEGWDFPLLDSVLFAENMSSNIRIVQSALRPCRKNKDNPNKKTNIILPVLYKNNWLEDNSDDLNKIREVIHQMSVEDDTIIEKITSIKLDSKKLCNSITPIDNQINDFNNNIELNELIKLKSIDRTDFKVKYNRAKEIIKSKGITTKKEYYDLCKLDCRLPEDPKQVYKTKFLGWIDYLSIDRKYYDFNTCKAKVKEYLQSKKIERILDPLETCNKLQKYDNNFPPYDLWCDYYNKKTINEILYNLNQLYQKISNPL